MDALKVNQIAAQTTVVTNLETQILGTLNATTGIRTGGLVDALAVLKQTMDDAQLAFDPFLNDITVAAYRTTKSAELKPLQDQLESQDQIGAAVSDPVGYAALVAEVNALTLLVKNLSSNTWISSQRSSLFSTLNSATNAYTNAYNVLYVTQVNVNSKLTPWDTFLYGPKPTVYGKLQEHNLEKQLLARLEGDQGTLSTLQ